MSETIDLPLLSGNLQGLEREVRLLRVQLDQLAGAIPPRLTSVEARLGVVEQSVHDLAAEVSRGMGQLEQHLVRHEKRFDVLDTGLTALRHALTESTEQIVQAIARGPESPKTT